MDPCDFQIHAVLMGSPTMKRGISFSISGIMEMIRGLNFKNKKAVAFGNYGWSGQGVRTINEGFKYAGFEIVDEGIRAIRNPDECALEQCTELCN